MEIKIGLFEKNKNGAWSNLLDSEGVPWEECNDKSNLSKYSIIIFPNKKQGINRNLREYILNGGILLGNEINYKKTRKIKFLILRDLLSKEKIKIYVDKIIPEGEITESKMGKGTIVNLPFDYNSLFFDQRSIEKKLGDGFFDPIEKVSLVDKNKLYSFLSNSIKYCFFKRKIPYIQKWYYPGQFDNVFVFRIDLDNYRKKQFNNLISNLKKNKISITWFMSMKEIKSKKVVKSLKLANQDIQSHLFTHKIFNSFEKNLNNFRKARKALLKKGASIQGCAGPFGKWNPEFQKVLEIEKCKFSSEFSLNYDSFPFFINNVLQIPIHPGCFGSMIYPDFDLVKDYFKRIINKRMESDEPLIFYGHLNGLLGEHPELITFIKKEITKTKKNVKVMNMNEFSNWWIKRSKINPRIFFDKKKVRIMGGKDISFKVISPKYGTKIFKKEISLGKLKNKKKFQKSFTEYIPIIWDDPSKKTQPSSIEHTDDSSWINFYKNFAKNLRTHTRIHRNLQKELIKNSEKGEKILEVGCGTGIDSIYLSKEGRVVTCTDISQNSLNLTNKNSKLFSSKIKIKKENAFNLPFENEKFDLVFSCGLIHFFKDPSRLIEEQKRVLKRGGILIVDVPYSLSPFMLLKHIKIFLGKHPWGWEREYTKKNLKRLLNNKGLKCLRTYEREVDSFTYKFLNITKTRYKKIIPFFMREKYETFSKKMLNFMRTHFPEDIGVIAKK